MKFIMAIQFILSMETYYVDGHKVTNEINGRFSYTNTKVWLKIEGVIEEYDVIKISKIYNFTFIEFEDETCFGQFTIGFDFITGQFITEDEDFTIKYTITKIR